MGTSVLGEDLRTLKDDLSVPGGMRVPKGAVLATPPSTVPSAATLLESHALPAVVHFRLRSIGLGFVVRLRQRFGLRVTDVCQDGLRMVLEASTERRAAIAEDEEWVDV